MSMIKRKIYFGLISILTGVLQLTASVQADVYPGSNCVRWSGSETINYDASSIINSSSTKGLYIDCPVLQRGFHVGTDPNDPGIADGWFRVYAEGARQHVRCTMANAIMEKSGQFNEKGKWIVKTNTKTSLGEGVYKVNFGFLGVVHPTDSHTFLSCYIPPAEGTKRARLNSYSVSTD